ncbi:MAG: SurA N-terminal domain-containing protein, partial [Parachlamydiaceae bacterium]|nr:SurA N-terminal domain-containing protein [Parachlamydiaceae bacterium]
MLDLFRRYQKYLYIAITIVIVISFSFFGTYSTLSNNSFREQIAFTTVDGTSIPRHELDEMVTFIGTDSLDKLLLGGAWGPNFLNSGVIKQDFLETGLAAMLIEQYPTELQKDLETRFEKEKRFSLYRNPQTPSIGVEAAWNNFSPAMKTHYDALKANQNPLSTNAINSRIALFLGERQFPASLLRQVIRYQEKQYGNLSPDRQLEQIDLSLFNYHTLEDWFGPRFTRLVAQFIMNASIIAEQKGYQVSKADALADLMKNSEASFQQNARNPQLAVANSQEYFNEQLRRLNMDSNKAAKLWRQVLLFQRYFQDVGSSMFVDPHTFAKMDSYALEGVEGEMFHLPKEMRLANFQSLQKFEIYLNAVSKRGESEKDLMLLPTKFLSVDEISKSTPELVQKRYILEIASVDKKALQSKVTVKDTWNWEVEDKNWELIKKQFPDLKAKSANTRDERFAVLDALDDKMRSRIDAYARSAFTDSHPEWIDIALDEAPVKKMTVGLHPNGGVLLNINLAYGKDLLPQLDALPSLMLQQAELTPAVKAAAEKFATTSADGNTYYRIAVIERVPELEIMTFAEANNEGALDKLLDKKLEAYYKKIREADATEFQQADKSWKPLNEVKTEVAERYFEKTLKAIQTSYAAAIAPEKAPQKLINDYAATLRFFAYMQNAKNQMQKTSATMAELSSEPNQAISNEGSLPEHMALEDQWKLVRNAYKTTRSDSDNLLDHSELFALADNSWTKVNAPANGDINFFHLDRKISEPDPKAVAKSVTKARQLLSTEAQQKLMMLTLKEIKTKNAISLEYLDQTSETPQSEDEEALAVESPY